MNNRLRRRRAHDEGKRVDEIVGIDPGVKSDQLRAFDRKRRLMVEAVGSGVERVLERRLERDLTQTAVAIPGISKPRADQRFACDKAILGEGVFAVVIAAGLLEGAVAELHADAAHLVAIPSDADKSRDRLIRAEQNLRTCRRFVADRCGFLGGGEKTLCVNGEHRDDLPRSPPWATAAFAVSI